MPRLALFIISIFALALTAGGQQPATYNINKNNGISTNHVYTTLVDKYGYLWIATIDGVYRYNGYSLKRFGYKEGLLNTDVWDLYEDTKGRVWALSISEGLGYFMHGRYYSVKNNDTAANILYPSGITELGDSLVFLNKNPTPSRITISVVKNDTLYNIVKNMDGRLVKSFLLGRMVVAPYYDTIMKYSLKEWGQNDSKYDSLIFPGLSISIVTNTQAGSFANKYLFIAKRDDKKVLMYDVTRNIIDTLWIGNALHHCFPEKKTFNILSRSHFLIYDTALRLISVIHPAKHIPKLSQNAFFTYIMSDPFWGLAFSTDKSGLFINYSRESEFHDNNADLDGYTFSGYINDSIGAWWNGEQKQMAYVQDGKIISKQRIPAENHYKVISFPHNKSLMTNILSAYWLSPPHTPISFINQYDSADWDGRHTKLDHKGHLLWFLRGTVFTDSTTMYIVRGGVGIHKLTLFPEKKFVRSQSINDGNYTGITYNRKNQLVVAYYAHSIVIIDLAKNSPPFILNNRQLNTLGIRGIESVYADDFGNFFIKDYDNLYMYDWQHHKLKKLFRNLNLEKSILLVRNKTLYLAGNFGVVKSPITAPGKINNTRIYGNIKNIFYNYITDAQFGTNTVLLKTDKGQYTVDITGLGSVGSATGCKIVMSIADTLYNILPQDTIHIDQTIAAIGIDIINPTGTGGQNLEYSINNGSYTNTGMQIVLPVLEPGSYNTLSLYASDDSWRSPPLNVTIYIEPEWWQTDIARRIFFVLALLGFIGFVYFIIITTRRIVNRNNERRTRRRELELKSIYSQINPHFIFNSLSTAQYFVKKNKNKEAFEHISQFSGLLRAYIKSSRNTYITIAEEVENLKNYLELQLTRFEEKFEYTIEINPEVDVKTVKIPSLLLQPLVENALNHGIFHSDKKGHLRIGFKIDEIQKSTLICIVDDNGVGRQKSRELRGQMIRKADSYGTILIKELIDTFNKYEKINIEIEYIDKQLPETGTTVLIRIKDFTHAQ